MSAGAVGLVDTHVAEQRIRGPTEGVEVKALAHVTVVVHPIGLNLATVQGERPRDRSAAVPARLITRGEAALLIRGDDIAGTDTIGPQTAHDADEAVVAQALELGDAAARGLRPRAFHHGVDEGVVELGCLEPRPWQLQRRTELLQHVAHAGFAAGQVKGYKEERYITQAKVVTSLNICNQHFYSYFTFCSSTLFLAFMCDTFYSIQCALR